jgi:soluble lytic murein transglycosylase
MPRVPVAQPNTVAPASITGGRFQAAPDPGNIGAAVSRLGATGAQFVQAQDEIDALFDDTASRKSALELTEKVQGIVDGYKAQEGLNAVSARGDTEGELKRLHSDYSAKMQKGRMAKMFDDRTAVMLAEARGKISAHAIGQVKVEADRTQKAQIVTLSEMAASSYEDPEALSGYIQGIRDVASEQQKLLGWSDDTLAASLFDLESGVHKGVVERLAAEGDYTAAITYKSANEDKLSAKDELQLTSMLKPMQTRRDGNLALDAIMAGAPEPGKESSFTYQAPVKGQETSAFGEKRGTGTHNGLDIAAPLGSNINPIAPGKVVSVSSDSSSGNFVVIDHGDGRTSSYSHMSKHSVKVGDEVALTDSIGFVGTTGRSTGPHVHLVVKENGVAVDPKKYLGKSGQGSSGPRIYDKGQIYSAIDARGKAEGWEPEKVEFVKGLADDRIAREENIIQSRERQADRAASKLVADMGESFTSVAQLPANIRDSLSGDALRQYTGLAERNSAPKSVAPNGAKQRELNLLRVHFPEAFKEEALGKYAGLMTAAEFDTLTIKQAELRTDGFSLRPGIETAVKIGKRMGGIEISEEEFVAVFDIMEAEIKQHMKVTKKRPTDEVYDAAFRSAVREQATVNKGILFGLGPDSKGSIPRYKLSIENIPANVMAKVRASAEGVYGKNPTDEEIERTYRLGKDRPGYW